MEEIVWEGGGESCSRGGLEEGGRGRKKSEEWDCKLRAAGGGLIDLFEEDIFGPGGAFLYLPLTNFGGIWRRGLGRGGWWGRSARDSEPSRVGIILRLKLDDNISMVWHVLHLNYST